VSLAVFVDLCFPLSAPLPARVAWLFALRDATCTSLRRAGVAMAMMDKATAGGAYREPCAARQCDRGASVSTGCVVVLAIIVSAERAIKYVAPLLCS